MSNLLTIKNCKQLLLVSLLMVSALLLSKFGISAAFAQGLGESSNPIPVLNESTGGQTSFKALAVNIVNYFLYFLGFVATVMIIYGGAQYVTAAGAQEKVDNAKKIITYAIIGMIVILLSYTIVNTVLQSGTPGGQPQS